MTRFRKKRRNWLKKKNASTKEKTHESGCPPHMIETNSWAKTKKRSNETERISK